MVRTIVDQIIEHGEVRRGRLGVLIQDLTPELAEAMGIEATGGAVISRVVPASPAESAGLDSGDVVVSLNGQPIETSAELRNAVGLMRPGQKVELGVLRDGERRTVTATLGEGEQIQAQLGGPESRLAGATLSELPPEHPLYGEVEGVLVRDVEPGSRAAAAGLRPGDVIVSANRQAVSSPAELAEILATHRNQPLLLHVRRRDGALFIVIS